MQLHSTTHRFEGALPCFGGSKIFPATSINPSFVGEEAIPARLQISNDSQHPLSAVSTEPHMQTKRLHILYPKPYAALVALALLHFVFAH